MSMSSGGEWITIIFFVMLPLVFIFKAGQGMVKTKKGVDGISILHDQATSKSFQSTNMRKAALFMAAMLFQLSLLASTINWRLYTKDGSQSIDLKKTVWASESDGQQIIFSNEDGEGDFSNGIHFSYSPPRFTSHGMTTVPDEPTYMEIYVDGRKINTVSLRVIGGQFIIVDKRNVKYFLLKKKKKLLGIL